MKQTDGIFDLHGKVAIVTGGNGGIGFAIAKGLAAAGANVVVAARNQDKTERAVKELRALCAQALGLSTHVQDEASVQATVKATMNVFGRVDILVNNAGIAIRKMPQDYTIEEWDHVLKTDLTGVFLCSREVYPYMVNGGGGKIINIGSMSSLFGSEQFASYSASKGGVVQLSKSLALAWAKDNIQVNTILPGWIHSDLTAHIKTATQTPQPHNITHSKRPLGRTRGHSRSRGVPRKPCLRLHYRHYSSRG